MSMRSRADEVEGRESVVEISSPCDISCAAADFPALRDGRQCDLSDRLSKRERSTELVVDGRFSRQSLVEQRLQVLLVTRYHVCVLRHAERHGLRVHDRRGP